MQNVTGTIRISNREASTGATTATATVRSMVPSVTEEHLKKAIEFISVGSEKQNFRPSVPLS